VLDRAVARGEIPAKRDLEPVEDILIGLLEPAIVSS
jgi:hypothetical protein